MAKHTSNDTGMEALAGSVLYLAILLLIFLIYLLIRLAKKVYDAFQIKPKSPALIIPLCGIGIAMAVTSIPNGSLQVMGVSIGLMCLVVLALSAIGICMGHDPFMHEATPISSVLRRNWWADSTTVQAVA